MPWSPSSTEKFMSCPQKWWLDRQGVVGRARDESAMEQGTEFHECMASYWTDSPWIVPAYDLASPLVSKAVERTIVQEGVALREQGVVCVECVLGGTEEERLRHGRYPGTADLVTQNE